MGKVETTKALSPLQLSFKKDFSEKMLDFYVNMLKDINPVLLSKAVEKIINTKDFLPSIAELRRTSDELADKASGNRIKDVDEAWKEVLAEMQRAFIYKPRVFSSKAIEEAVDGMGWESLCNMEIKQESTFRAQFRDMYKAACDRHKNDRIDTRIGITEPPKIVSMKVKEIGHA